MSVPLADLTNRSVAVRLFLTCWMVYVLHFATDFSREHFLVVSIVEEGTFRLDRFAGMHPDIFRNPPEAPHGGAHHGANPGISMIAAIPYFVARPAVDWIVQRNLATRAPEDTTAVYNDPRPNRVKFYHEVRRLGLDIRFGLVEAITAAFCMAPLTALSVVVMFGLLLRLGLSRPLAVGFALLYAFGTPVFFRTAYLNQNVAVATFTFLAFVLLWDPGQPSRLSVRTRYFLAGLLGGLAFLCDYSGALGMGLLALYGWWRRRDLVSWGRGLQDSLWYGLGAAGPVLLLWYYQWASFGNPFYPPQHWMAPVKYIEVGYKGVGGVAWDLLSMLLFDPHFGLLVVAPILVLGLGTLWLARRGRGEIPFREAVVCLGLSAVFILFFSTVQYTRLQWVTGFRYLTPVVPFLFVLTIPVLLRLPRVLTYAAALISITITWSLCMVRSQGTVADNLKRVVLEGFQLPWLTVLAKTATQYAPWLTTVSPLPLFTLSGVVLFAIWTLGRPWRPLDRS